MGLFDMFKRGSGKESKNVEVPKKESLEKAVQREEAPKSASQSKKAGGHGDHWLVIAGSGEEVQSLIFDSIKNAGLRGTVAYDGRDLNSYISSGDLLKTCSITVGGMVYTAYPFADGIVHEITVEEVEEWRNGLEAQLRCTLGDACFAFFDTLYYKNRGKYTQGGTYRFSLSALAYNLKNAEPAVMKDRDGQEITTKGMAAFFPLNGGDIDDLMYYMPVKEVVELKFAGKDFYRIKATLLRISIEELYHDVDIYLYISKSATDGYVPKPGDDVTGALWLQGYMVD